MMAKKFLSSLIPGGLFFLTALVLMKGRVLVPWLPGTVQIAPGLIVAAAILLGLRFNRSRLVFAILMLAIADRSIIYFAQPGTATAKLIYNSIAILLPLNIAMLPIVKERGIITPRGLFRMSLIMLQPLAISAICLYRLSEFNAYLNHPIFRARFVERLPTAGLPPPVAAAMLLSLILIVYGLARRKGPLERGLAWAWVIVCYTLITRSTPPVSTFFFCTAGLLLIVSVIEASYVMAFRDELTGLPARRSLNEFIVRVGNHYSLAMVDIDFFKKVNDKHGHDVGDQVLAMVASKLAKTGGGGKAFRYGGEEFTLVFPAKTVDEAIPYLEELRSEIESSPFTIRSRSRPRKKPRKLTPGKATGKRLSVTVSMGVAERGGQHGKPRDVLKAADKALYRAKKGGRNRVCT